jgi:hypothetical protein
MYYSLSSFLLLVICTKNLITKKKVTEFFYLGFYCIQNIITASVYRAFRGYFLTSIINSQLRRRVAVRASFEVLRKRISSVGSIETRYYF